MEKSDKNYLRIVYDKFQLMYNKHEIHSSDNLIKMPFKDSKPVRHPLPRHKSAGYISVDTYLEK
jgi:hypothetical protein